MSEKPHSGIPDSKKERAEIPKIEIEVKKVNFSAEDILERGHWKPDMGEVWLYNYIAEAERQIAVQMRKLVEEKYPGILVAAQKIAENDETLYGMLKEDKAVPNGGYVDNEIKSSSYNLEKAELVYKENVDFYTKFGVMDPEKVGGMSAMKRIRILSEIDK